MHNYEKKKDERKCQCYNLGPDLDDPEMKDTLRLYVFVTRHHVKRPFVYK